MVCVLGKLAPKDTKDLFGRGRGRPGDFDNTKPANYFIFIFSGIFSLFQSHTHRAKMLTELLLALDDWLLREASFARDAWRWLNPALLLLQIGLIGSIRVVYGNEILQRLASPVPAIRHATMRKLWLFAFLEKVIGGLLGGVGPAERVILQFGSSVDGDRRRFVRQIQWFDPQHDPIVARLVSQKRAFKDLQGLRDRQDGILGYLVSIWRAVVRMEAAVPDSIPDDRWLALGFQGSDPSTDLRSTGVSSLWLIQAMTQTAPETSHLLYSRSQNKPGQW